jgi:hypothetical protein
MCVFIYLDEVVELAPTSGWCSQKGLHNPHLQHPRG